MAGTKITSTRDRNTRDRNPWWYSYIDVDRLYKKHYDRESQLKDAIYFKDGTFFVKISAGPEHIILEISPSFLVGVMDHLRDGLEKEWFRYIFWPDLNHGHLFLPEEIREKYIKLRWKDYYRLAFSDRKLGILYHAAEHFCHSDPANTRFIKTRNILGWFDGRPIELTAAKPDDNPERIKANNADIPEGHGIIWPIEVSASRKGLFRIFDRVHNRFVRLDVSFATIYGIYDSTTEEERTLEGRKTLGTKDGDGGDWR